VSVRRRGFTLIELLVVIAIIGILAAMLFPVFARARESARKTQCLANVKNIAMAVQIYLTDYDKLWPSEKRAEIVYTAPFNHQGESNNCDLMASTKMNPFLRTPVILDEYTKSRDVWSCPSARTSGGFPILNAYGGDWWTYIMSLGQDAAKAAFGQCGGGNYPPGWGGAVTDSNKQDTKADGPGAFHNSINTIEMRDVGTSQMNDPSMFVVCGEASLGQELENPVQLAYPDAFAMCGANPGSVACCGGNWVDWANCSWSRECGASHDLNYSDTQVRKQYGRARHLGGSNVGFADGHAKWFNSEDILNSFAPDEDWRDDGPATCFASSPGAGAARKERNTWGGFYNGLCHFWGAFGVGPHC
jgi:prepilin-type N-terminal cleavage/methylation domain-containing protein/prepilin-type processing-associated H-X9-DG protein